MILGGSQRGHVGAACLGASILFGPARVSMADGPPDGPSGALARSQGLAIYARHARAPAYNGAAAGRVREVGYVPNRSSRALLLQWGRGWTAAEGQASRIMVTVDDHTSMGPRLDGRGRLR